MSLIVLFLLVLLAVALPDLCPDVMGLSEHAPNLWVALALYLALRTNVHARHHRTRSGASTAAA